MSSYFDAFFIIFNVMKKNLVLTLLCLLCCYAFAKAQSEQLARNYADQGEFEKAILTYKKILQKQRGDRALLVGLTKSYQQLEQYDNAREELSSYLSKMRDKGFLMVELGYNEQLSGNDSLAVSYYKRAINGVSERTMNAHIVARTFQVHSLLEQAVSTYEAGAIANPNSNYSCLLYTSPSPRDLSTSRMPSSA